MGCASSASARRSSYSSTASAGSSTCSGAWGRSAATPLERREGRSPPTWEEGGRRAHRAPRAHRGAAPQCRVQVRGRTPAGANQPSQIDQNQSAEAVTPRDSSKQGWGGGQRGCEVERCHAPTAARGSGYVPPLRFRRLLAAACFGIAGCGCGAPNARPLSTAAAVPSRCLSCLG